MSGWRALTTVTHAKDPFLVAESKSHGLSHLSNPSKTCTITPTSAIEFDGMPAINCRFSLDMSVSGGWVWTVAAFCGGAGASESTTVARRFSWAISGGGGGWGHRRSGGSSLDGGGGGDGTSCSDRNGGGGSGRVVVGCGCRGGSPSGAGGNNAGLRGGARTMGGGGNGSIWAADIVHVFANTMAAMRLRHGSVARSMHRSPAGAMSLWTNDTVVDIEQLFNFCRSADLE
eukprot:scaffold34157_cov112-Isochrysis_galbana.AAC.2